MKKLVLVALLMAVPGYADGKPAPTIVAVDADDVDDSGRVSSGKFIMTAGSILLATGLVAQAANSNNRKVRELATGVAATGALSLSVGFLLEF